MLKTQDERYLSALELLRNWQRKRMHLTPLSFLEGKACPLRAYRFVEELQKAVTRPHWSCQTTSRKSMGVCWIKVGGGVIVVPNELYNQDGENWKFSFIFQNIQKHQYYSKVTCHQHLGEEQWSSKADLECKIKFISIWTKCIQARAWESQTVKAGQVLRNNGASVLKSVSRERL